MIPIAEARRIALAALGFDVPRPQRPGARQLAAVIDRLGLVQIDAVNVLVPAHYLVLFSRLGSYSRERFDRLIYEDRRFVEQWAHEASIVPMSTWPLLRHRRAEFRLRPYSHAEFLDRHRDYQEWVFEQVRQRGPLTAADLPEPAGVERRVGEVWFGTVPRIVLEALFARGRLAIAGRQTNFARTYDLAERVVPAVQLDRELGREEADREMLRIAAKAYGIATADDLADYFRMKTGIARPRIAELVASGDLEAVEVEGWRAKAYLYRDARRPRRMEAAALLSPFDPLVWYRPRASRLFGFDYRIEIYTPPAQRKYGYYVLPFLLGDRIVARVDLKADRKAKRLLVLSEHFEPEVKPPVVRPALDRELRALAAWLGLDSIHRPARD